MSSLQEPPTRSRPTIERLPWVGRAVTFTFETGGRFATDIWTPNCADGGWCPNQNQIASREIATTIQGSTDSIRSFLRTQPSSLAVRSVGYDRARGLRLESRWRSIRLRLSPQEQT